VLGLELGLGLGLGLMLVPVPLLALVLMLELGLTWGCVLMLVLVLGLSSRCEWVHADSCCQVQVYSGRGSGQVWTKVDEGQGQGAGQEVSLARVGDRLDSTTKDNER